MRISSQPRFCMKHIRWENEVSVILKFQSLRKREYKLLLSNRTRVVCSVEEECRRTSVGRREPVKRFPDFSTGSQTIAKIMQQYRYCGMPEDLISPFRNMALLDEYQQTPSDFLNDWYHPRPKAPLYYVIYDPLEQVPSPPKSIICQNCGATVETSNSNKTTTIPEKVTTLLRQDSRKEDPTKSKTIAISKDQQVCYHPMCAKGCTNRCKQVTTVPNRCKVTTVPSVSKFEVHLDVGTFDPEDIQVKISDRKLMIDAKKEMRDPSGTFAYVELHRQYYIPDHVNPDEVISHLDSTGKLTIEAPIVIALKGPQDVPTTPPVDKGSS